MSEAADRALALHRAGRLAEAESGYRAALAANPDDVDALRLLGVVRTQQGHHGEALALVTEALRRDPGSAKAHATRGSILQALRRPEEALASYDQAVAIDPALAEPHYNRGLVLQALGRHTEALASYDRALAIKPDLTEALIHRGNALQALDRHAEALASYERALAIKPDLVEALNNRATALQALGRDAEALASYDRVLALKPRSAGALFNRGTALDALNRDAEALASYDQAIAIDPGVAETHYRRGFALQALNRHAEALASIERALSLNPDYADARWSLAMFQIPPVYAAGADPGRYRAAFAKELDRLDRWLDSSRIASACSAVGNQQPFYLAYQEENNRDLLQRYGNLCARIMAAWLERQSFAPPGRRGAGGPIRVGVVSRHFQYHSVWSAIVKGWFQRLDGARFALYGFHLGPSGDQETRFAQSRATHFEQGRRGLRQWVEAILGQQLDVLIYPELGMDPMTVKLASLRLAPVQVTTWGHPETSGLPTMDYFLSAEDLEPTGAQAGYVERLVTLPHLGCFYQPGQVIARAPDLPGLGLDPNAPILLCPGMPFKYAPQHDRVLTEIARRLGRCQLVFFAYQTRNLSDQLRQRLGLAFAGAGLDSGRFVTFIPWQNREAFYGLLARADLFLDTIGFSGFNTAMQAIECGLPIVTREGRFLRGRLASGILRRMGLPELVAGAEDEYIRLAVKLGQDAHYRAQTRERIAASRHLLFEDIASIRALEDFLTTATA